MLLRFTTPMEMFFYVYCSLAALCMIVAMNPQHNYDFAYELKIYLFICTMVASPIQYWVVWNYPNKVMEFSKKFGLHGVDFTHYVVGFIKLAELLSYIYLVDGGRLLDLYNGKFEFRRFDEMLVCCLIAGQALNLSVYNVLGVDGVNYGAQMGRPIAWIHGFPFNTGTRHPQYIGCVLAWLALFTLLTPTSQLGKLVVAAWATAASYWYSGEVEVEEPPDSHDKGTETGKKGVTKRQ